MNKQELIQALQSKYQQFVVDIEILNEEEFNKAPTGKWTAGQQLDHLCRSLFPLVWGLKLPKFLPRLLFGRANRPSKSYDDLVAKYQRKIEDGAKATGPFIPKAIPFTRKKALLRKLKNSVKSLCRSINNYSEKQLDQLILPHPLLGKLTLREMLYFTTYHAEHHRKLVERGLQQG